MTASSIPTPQHGVGLGAGGGRRRLSDGKGRCGPCIRQIWRHLGLSQGARRGASRCLQTPAHRDHR